VAVNSLSDLEPILRCPRCRCPLALADPQRPACSNTSCRYQAAGFPVVDGQPVLIDFDDSIFTRAGFAEGRGSVIPRFGARSLRNRLRQFAVGGNPVTPGNSRQFVAAAKQLAPRPLILVIGGGVRGSGMEAVYADPALRVVGSDVYASPETRLVLDGHHLPFADGAFEGVWIQAVLEHVLDPPVIVAEIRRVLKPGGLVYADTPFMQPVHERAYDFTRFTLSGHRWLFRNFEQIDAGVVGGVGTSAIWSIRYLMRAFLGNKLSQLLAMQLFWLRYFDGLARRRPNADGAAGVYFLGRRSEQALTPQDMVAYYEGQQ
jgi:SAM-dependent methyltransferase